MSGYTDEFVNKNPVYKKILWLHLAFLILTSGLTMFIGHPANPFEQLELADDTIYWEAMKLIRDGSFIAAIVSGFIIYTRLGAHIIREELSKQFEKYKDRQKEIDRIRSDPTSAGSVFLAMEDKSLLGRGRIVNPPNKIKTGKKKGPVVESQKGGSTIADNNKTVSGAIEILGLINDGMKKANANKGELRLLDCDYKGEFDAEGDYDFDYMNKFGIQGVYSFWPEDANNAFDLKNGDIVECEIVLHKPKFNTVEVKDVGNVRKE